MVTDHDILMQVRERQDAIDRQLQEARELKSQASATPASNTGSATINVNAGGIGIWIAVTCSVVSVGFMLVALMLYVDISRKVDRATDYQQANYRK